MPTLTRLLLFMEEVPLLGGRKHVRAIQAICLASRVFCALVLLLLRQDPALGDMVGG